MRRNRFSRWEVARRAGPAPLIAPVVVLALAIAACSDGDSDAELLVGAAKRDITPTVATAPPDGSVYLGGYGFGPVRLSTGVLAPVHVRAMVISNGEQTIAFAESETQGAFAAYKTGPFGSTDIASAVEQATAGAIPHQNVIISSDHSHAGPDTTGIWGGLPDSYLQFLKDQTVGAIIDAFAARVPAALSTGTTDATSLLNSQFDQPPNDQVDGELRVLVASSPSDPSRRPAILINFAAHATVMGSDNTLVSADWPGMVADEVERALGIDTAVVMVADVGRTQPDDGQFPGGDVQRLEGYSQAVTDRVLAAVARLEPHQGSAIAATQLFLRERYSNPFFPLALIGSAISRSADPPWLDGEQVGSLVGAARVGDLLFAAIPGEGYPAIEFAMRDRVPAGRHFIFGLANDQLGYLISPAEGYPQIAAAAPDNDNALFNVSPSFGDHVTCTLFKAASAIGFEVADQGAGDAARCAPYAGEDNTLPF